MLRNTSAAVTAVCGSFGVRRASVYRVPNSQEQQLDDVQRELVASVSRFAREEIAPIAERIDKENKAPMRELFTRMGSLGLLGITVPATHGGLGLGYLEHCLVMEEISRASAAVGLAYGAHSNLCVNQIRLRGTDEQRRALLPRLVSGEAIGALAMTEPDAGSDVIAMRTTAKRVSADQYALNGTKTFITNGGVADVYVVYARTNADAKAKPSKSISAFVVEKGTKGFGFGPKMDKLGMRGCETCQLLLDDCRVPAANMIGKENDGARILMSGLDTERLVLAAGPVGIMAACLDVVVPYVKQRKQFGKSIAAQQLIQSKVAEMYSMMCASRAHVHAVARAADAGKISAADCASAIMFSSECATKVALETVQCLGGYGYMNEYPAGRLLRDAKLYEIGAGTAEIRRIVIARELFKHDA